MAETVDLIQGTYVAAYGGVVGFLPIQPFDRKVTNIVISGPSRSTFRVYRGTSAIPSNQIFATPEGGGGSNQYDSTTLGAPVTIGHGEQVMGVWTGGATTAASTGTATVRSVR